MSHWNHEHLEHIADLLMAAASADNETHSAERGAINAILSTLAGGSLPASLEARARDFNPDGFDMAATVKALGPLDAEHRRDLLGLVSKVTESDDVHDLDESDFIVRLARAIGASPAEYEGLTVELTPSGRPPLLARQGRARAASGDEAVEAEVLRRHADVAGEEGPHRRGLDAVGGVEPAPCGTGEGVSIWLSLVITTRILGSPASTLHAGSPGRPLPPRSARRALRYTPRRRPSSGRGITPPCSRVVHPVPPRDVRERAEARPVREVRPPTPHGFVIQSA
ncbi:MAG: TerB family tellurite resistance protein [Polyangiales bacterium]